ncbi:hypothetical protein G7048_03815 [Diaphorobacter sp. HDW4B]|uniref:hypothetical protein n=1 Tax=Diaphorobacter sp. HDW4B TaxID=2714925 RepID=UPI00140E3FD4|nr:hypothetical protein [Diaphorobacter sp. HDW4B]QIL69576.1 hypothetical protein G7048_03815 [Diaphorobacter sp. HDW4B]
MTDQVIKQIHEKYKHTSDVAGFIRELNDAGVTMGRLGKAMRWDYEDMVRAAHLGERIISPAENAALLHGAALKRALRQGELQPSKRELLEQILAEQRKMNELLGGWAEESWA